MDGLSKFSVKIMREAIIAGESLELGFSAFENFLESNDTEYDDQTMLDIKLAFYAGAFHTWFLISMSVKDNSFPDDFCIFESLTNELDTFNYLLQLKGDVAGHA